MNLKKVRQQIIDAINETFTIVNDDYLLDGWNPIEMSTDYSVGHTDFSNALADKLNEVFPGRKHPIVVDNCDTLRDIIHNNFGDIEE
jgi:hypothetical protein